MFENGKVVVLMLCGVVAASLGWVWMQDSELVSESIQPDQLIKVELQPSTSTKKTEQVAVKTEMPIEALGPHDELAEPMTKTEPDVKNMWALSPRAEQELKALGYIPPNIADEQYVDVNIRKFMSLEKDQAFEIEIPQLGEYFVATVSLNEKDEDGIWTMQATIDYEERPLNVLISYSDDSIVGEISTPTGDYLIEGTEQYAWLAPRQSIAANTRPDVEVMDELETKVSDEVVTDLPTSL